MGCFCDVPRGSLPLIEVGAPPLPSLALVRLQGPADSGWTRDTLNGGAGTGLPSSDTLALLVCRVLECVFCVRERWWRCVTLCKGGGAGQGACTGDAGLLLKCPWPGVAYLKWRLKTNIYVASLAESYLAMRLIAKTRDLTKFGQFNMNLLSGPQDPWESSCRRQS